jgi:hypothetical protein
MFLWTARVLWRGGLSSFGLWSEAKQIPPLRCGMTTKKTNVTQKAAQTLGSALLLCLDLDYPKGSGLLLGGGLGAGRAGEDGVVAAVAREQDGQRDGEQHEQDGGPGGELGEQVGGAAGTEGGLRALTAEGTGEVGGLALLQKNDADQEEANDDVDEDKKVNHRELCDLFGADAMRRNG